MLCTYIFASPSLSNTEVGDYSGNVFEADVFELNRLLDAGVLTSEQICEFYIERINTYDKSGITLNSVIYLNTSALEQARALDSERKAGRVRSKLHGIPILVKDNIDVKGFPTSLGHPENTEVKTENAPIVEKLINAGAIILGKTNLSTDDLATRCTVSEIIGETRNPYNISYSSGGSSGGSAAAVSANLALLSLATDTNCSALYPAAVCGVCALRPTVSLLDYSGCASVNSARDTLSPMAKSVSDLSVIMDVMTETENYSAALSKDALKGKTVAVVKELSEYTFNSFPEFKNCDKEIGTLFNKAVSELEACGATVVTVSLPKLFTYYSACRESAKNSANAKAALTAEVQKALSDAGASALVFPAYLNTPLASGFNGKTPKSDGETYLNCGAYLAPLIGLPAVTVPMGFHSSGIPLGLEMVTLKNCDAELLSYAYAYEQASLHRSESALIPNLQAPKEFIPESEPQTPTPDTDIETPAPKDESHKSFVLIFIAVLIVMALGAWLVFFNVKAKRKGANRHRHF